ncbi:MAG: hypothetical protein V1709_08830, partial [Planctomycetota bacterium]
MAGQVIYLPKTQSGLESFNESFSPYLQQAMAQYQQRKMAEFALQKQQEMANQQRELDRISQQKALEQYGAYSKTPELGQFMQPNENYPQGIQLPIQGKFKESYDLSKIPEGVKIGSGGEMTFSAPDPMSQYYKLAVADY